MHMGNMAKGMIPAIAIVGGGIPLATGIALAFKMRKSRQVAACFFGDGAVAEGEFHECLNLSALWQLPILFCCENNLYAMGTALARAQAQTDLAVRAASYGLPAWAVDGMDVLAVEQAARHAADAVRGGAHVLLRVGGHRHLDDRDDGALRAAHAATVSRRGPRAGPHGWSRISPHDAARQKPAVIANIGRIPSASATTPPTQGPANMPTAYTAWWMPMAVLRWAPSTFSIERPIRIG